MTQRTQNSPLKWYTNSKYQRDNLPYTQTVYVDPVPLNQIPPFKFPREKTGNQAIYFRLHNCSTGVVIDITAEIKEAGLGLQEYAEYDLLYYPARTRFIGVALAYGTYYCTMSDGPNIWTSEKFTMVDGIDRLMKIEWCNREDIEYKNGRLNYSGGYRNTIYLNSALGKPIYPTKKEAEARQGRNFYTEKIYWKEYQFSVVIPEHVMDTMRTIDAHDIVTLTDNGQEYEVEELIFTDPSWNKVGDLAEVDFKIITDTFITKTASGLTDNCSIVPGTCIDKNQTAVALLVKNSDLYLDHQYIDKNGATQNLVSGNYVLISNLGTSGTPITLEQFNGSGYTGVISLPGNVVYNSATNHYYENEGILVGYKLPYIVSYTTGVLTAMSLDGTINEVWARFADLSEIFLGAFSSTVLEAGQAITVPSGATALFLKVGSVLCGNFYQSALFSVAAEVVGCNIIIKGEFTGPVQAAENGLVSGDYYILSNDNVYGWQYGQVMRLDPATTYNSDAAATTGGVADDDCYSVGASNLYDMSAHAVKVLNPSTTYDSNADAAANGVAIGEQYATSLTHISGTPFEGFLIIRKF